MIEEDEEENEYLDEQESEDESDLRARQELFCELYVSKEFFANGVQSYVQAYSINLARKGAYDVAKVGASRLLTNLNVCRRIAELMEKGGLNDSFVDNQLLFLITQFDDPHAKLGAIREYNKLKGRIVEKKEIKTEKIIVNRPE